MSLSNEKDFLKRLTKKTLIKDFSGRNTFVEGTEFICQQIDDFNKVFLTGLGPIAVFDNQDDAILEVTMCGETIVFLPLSAEEIVEELIESDLPHQDVSWAEMALNALPFVAEDYYYFTIQMKKRFGEGWHKKPAFRSFIAHIFAVLWPKLRNQ